VVFCTFNNSFLPFQFPYPSIFATCYPFPEIFTSFPFPPIRANSPFYPSVRTAIYDSKVKLFLKQGISHQLGRDAVVRFECDNSAIDVIINFLEKNVRLLVAITSRLGKMLPFYNKKLRKKLQQEGLKVLFKNHTWITLGFPGVSKWAGSEFGFCFEVTCLGFPGAFVLS
jgi:hypothetical protein